MIRPWLQHNFSPIPFLENDSISIKSDSVVTVDWKRNGDTETEGPTRTDHFNLQLITYLASLLSGFQSYLFSELFLGKEGILLAPLLEKIVPVRVVDRALFLRFMGKCNVMIRIIYKSLRVDPGCRKDWIFYPTSTTRNGHISRFVGSVVIF